MWRWSKFKMKRHSFITLKHLPFDWCMRAWKGLRMRERARKWRQKNSVQFSRDGVICGEWMAHELVEGLFRVHLVIAKIFSHFLAPIECCTPSISRHSLEVTSLVYYFVIFTVSRSNRHLYIQTLFTNNMLQHSKTIQQLKLTNGNPWITWFFRIPFCFAQRYHHLY